MLSEERVERINENKILYDNTAETCLGNHLKTEKEIQEAVTLHVLHSAVIIEPSRRIAAKLLPRHEITCATRKLQQEDETPVI